MDTGGSTSMACPERRPARPPLIRAPTGCLQSTNGPGNPESREREVNDEEKDPSWKEYVQRARTLDRVRALCKDGAVRGPCVRCRGDVGRVGRIGGGLHRRSPL